MQIVLEVSGDQLKPDVASIMAALTDEDKRTLAVQIAREYFVEDMKREYGSSWGGRCTGASRFVEELVAAFRKMVQSEVAARPELKAEVERISKAVGEQFPSIILLAMTQHYADSVQTQIAATMNTEVKLAQLESRLKAALAPDGG